MAFRLMSKLQTTLRAFAPPSSAEKPARSLQPRAKPVRYCTHSARGASLFATHSFSAPRAHTAVRANTSEVSRRKSVRNHAHYAPCLRKSFTHLPKVSFSLYTCSEHATNCRDAPTRTRQTTRKPQLTSCIYVANLMQLRRCERRYVACAPPRNRFRDHSRINNPEGEAV